MHEHEREEPVPLKPCRVGDLPPESPNDRFATFASLYPNAQLRACALEPLASTLHASPLEYPAAAWHPTDIGVLVDEGLLGSFLWYRGSASAGFGIGFKGLYKSLNLQIVSGCAGLLPAKAVLLPSQAGSTTAYICAG